MAIEDIESFNTNNAWGFGGDTGKKHTHTNGCFERKGSKDKDYRGTP